MTRIALLSPNQNAYSETFIQAHKNRLEGQIAFYYGGYFPSHLEGKGFLFHGNAFRRIWRKAIFRARKTIGLTSLSLQEEVLFHSLKKEKIEIVFAEYGTTGCKILPVCIKRKLPLIVHFHGFDASLISVLENYREQYIDMFEYASHIVVVSWPMYKKLSEMGAPEEKLVYNPYGPDESFFNVEPTYEEKAFLSVGRFVDKKAPYYTILAFSKVLAIHPDALLYMAGDGVLHNACKNLVKYLGIEKNVIFLGVVTPEQFRQRLSTVRAFVQHSITADNGDMEGSPVAIMEAQAAGVPVISTLHAGIPEVVVHGASGWLVKEGDVDGMAQSMLSLLADNQLAEMLGHRGREIIQEKFLMEQHIEKLNECIEASIKNQKPPK